MTRQSATRRTRGVLGGRSERIVEQVLTATVAELAVSGYGAFRMDRVSERAGVNKTTIYRRWPAKAPLVAAAVEWMRLVVHDVPLPDTGSLERDLVAAFRRRTSFGRKVEGRAWGRLFAERHDPEVQIIIGGAVRERSEEWYAMVTRAITRGELPRGTDPKILLRMLGAIVDAWTAGSIAPSNGAWLDAVVRTIVVGARSGSLVLGGKRASRASRPREKIGTGRRR